VQRRKLGTWVCLLAVVCGIMQRSTNNVGISIFSRLNSVLFTLSIYLQHGVPPTWRCVVTMTSMTSLHLTYKRAPVISCVRMRWTQRKGWTWSQTVPQV